MSSGEGALHRVWIVSDIQMRDSTLVRDLFRSALRDWHEQNLTPQEVWLLGDSVCGRPLSVQEEMAQTIMDALSPLSCPVAYVLGNHEMDLLRSEGTSRFPLRELALARPDWRVPPGIEDFYFLHHVGQTLVVFLSDHAARDGSWMSSHGQITDPQAGYPDPEPALAALREAMARHPGPIVIAAHYALPGGQRPNQFQARLFPLPDSVRLHLYGHAHIGDLVYNRINPWQRQHAVEGHAFPQFNISAFENQRTPGCHTALLEFSPAEPVRLRVRCHLAKSWILDHACRLSGPAHGACPGQIQR